MLILIYFETLQKGFQKSPNSFASKKLNAKYNAIKNVLV